MKPSRVLLIMASSALATMAASRAAYSSLTSMEGFMSGLSPHMIPRVGYTLGDGESPPHSRSPVRRRVHAARDGLRGAHRPAPRARLSSGRGGRGRGGAARAHAPRGRAGRPARARAHGRGPLPALPAGTPGHHGRERAGAPLPSGVARSIRRSGSATAPTARPRRRSSGPARPGASSASSPTRTARCAARWRKPASGHISTS